MGTIFEEIRDAVSGVTSAITGTLTVATHAVTQSGNWVLSAGANIIGKVDHSTTGIGNGHKEVTAAGTALALASSTAAKWVTVQAYRANTGYIGVGGAGVLASAAIGTGTGVSLAAGESITYPIDSLADVFVDATVNGEGVRFTYGT